MVGSAAAASRAHFAGPIAPNLLTLKGGNWLGGARSRRLIVKATFIPTGLSGTTVQGGVTVSS
jgi:hypothetical protein